MRKGESCGMIEIIHQEQTEEKVQRELPREIKQIGSPDAGERIYVEDTVYRRMHPHGGVEEKTAYVLLENLRTAWAESARLWKRLFR